MLQRFFKAGVAALYFAALCLPAVQMTLAPFSFRTLSENRNLTVEPDTHLKDRSLIERIYLGGVDYTRKYESYFNDHFGLRSFLIMLKNQFDYSIFGVSDDLIIGNDGFLFQKVVVEADLINAERVTDKQIVSVQSHILEMQKYLARRGITLIALLCRERESIYPEMLLNPTSRRPAPTRIEKYVEFFKDHPEIPFVDSGPLLLEMKKKFPVFYKTDFHWNTIGAYSVAEKLIPLLQRTSGLKEDWDIPLRVRAVPGFNGTANMYLATFDPDPETALEIESSDASNLLRVNPPQFPAEIHTRSDRQDKSKLVPKTVFLGNSFSPYFFKIGAAKYFDEATYVFKGNLLFRKLPELLMPETKFVVWQFNEFDLGTFYVQENVLKNFSE